MDDAARTHEAWGMGSYSPRPAPAVDLGTPARNGGARGQPADLGHAEFDLDPCDERRIQASPGHPEFDLDPCDERRIQPAACASRIRLAGSSAA
jgi:hypothetical protein